VVLFVVCDYLADAIENALEELLEGEVVQTLILSTWGSHHWGGVDEPIEDGCWSLCLQEEADSADDEWQSEARTLQMRNHPVVQRYLQYHGKERENKHTHHQPQIWGPVLSPLSEDPEGCP